jgi:hypothetical protein
MYSLQTRCAYLALALTLMGCAKASYSNQVQYTPIASSRPSRVVIYPFSIDPSDIGLNQSFLQRTYQGIAGENENAQQIQIAHDTAQNVCLEVVNALNNKGYSAICQQRGVPITTANTLFVDGIFTDIDEGNRLRRTVVGFGAGASTLDTAVYVFQFTPSGEQHQVLSFATHADSGKMPGMIATGPAGAAAGGSAAAATLGANAAMGVVKAHRSSTGFLGDKTAEQISEALENYFVQQGWAG